MGKIHSKQSSRRIAIFADESLARIVLWKENFVSQGGEPHIIIELCTYRRSCVHVIYLHYFVALVFLGHVLVQTVDKGKTTPP